MVRVDFSFVVVVVWDMIFLCYCLLVEYFRKIVCLFDEFLVDCLIFVDYV